MRTIPALIPCAMALHWPSWRVRSSTVDRKRHVVRDNKRSVHTSEAETHRNRYPHALIEGEEPKILQDCSSSAIEVLPAVDKEI